MNIAHNWLKDFVDFDLTPETLSALLTDIGLEVSNVQRYESIKGGLKDIIVGQVLTCRKHPNADRLAVTTVDIGSDEVVRIVCGAPNVNAGQKVLVAKVGATIYKEDGSSFSIKKAKIRGEHSQGMICAEDELGLGSNHDGIMVLPDDYKVGAPATDYFEVDVDYVYDIDLTPNRSDATSHYGVAKDLLAALKIRENSPLVFKPLDAPVLDIVHDKRIKVEVKNPEACPRYTGIYLSNLCIKDSPVWIQNRLKSIGIRPINNVVDITNYVLHEYGQPLHAFDAKKIKGSKIIVSCLPDKTTFHALDDTYRTLESDDLMICDGTLNPLCMAGIFGGMDSGVTEKTTDLFLESAYFDAKFIRRSSTRHLLRTEAAKIFEKKADPDKCIIALKRAVSLLKTYAGARVSSELIDVHSIEKKHNTIRLSLESLQRLVGHPFTKRDVQQILTALDMHILRETDQDFLVQIPKDKADVLREADLIEEVLRIYGYNRVEESQKLAYSLQTHDTQSFYGFKEQIATSMKGAGYLEMMGLSLVETNQMTSLLGIRDDQCVRIHNTSNVHLDTLRPSMVLSALEAVHHNISRRQTDLKLFEIGKEYLYTNGQIHERNVLTICITGKESKPNWLIPKPTLLSFYHLKSVTDALLLQFGWHTDQITQDHIEGFVDGLQYKADDLTPVRLGRLSDDLLRFKGISQDVYLAWIDLDYLYTQSHQPLTLKPISKYPSVYRDIAVKVKSDVTYLDIEHIIRQHASSKLVAISLFDVYQNEALKKENKKSLAISLELSDQEKTLTDKEIDQTMQRIVKNLQKDVGAELR